LSLYAVTTNRDLGGMGQYLFAGLIGIIIASVVNMFLGSATLDYAISFIGVFLFMGLTAYDTQMIKRWSDQMGNSADEADYMRVSIMGALKLYLDFINLFLFLLRFLGNRR
jgi:FtsH-binding integral membrane protein